MEYVKIVNLDGNIEEGFQVSHPSKLPKKAILHRCFYDNDINMYHLYLHTTPKQTKWYIWKTPQISHQNDIDNLPPSKYKG